MAPTHDDREKFGDDPDQEVRSAVPRCPAKDGKIVGVVPKPDILAKKGKDDGDQRGKKIVSVTEETPVRRSLSS